MRTDKLIRAKVLKIQAMQNELANLELQEIQGIPCVSLQADQLARRINRDSRIIRALNKRL